MKNKLFYLFITISAIGFSQTLEHSYTTGGSPDGENLTFITSNGINYYTINNDADKVLFYNNDHNLINTVNIILPTSETIRTLSFITDKLFNANSKIEFIVISNLFNMYLFDEDGNKLFEFGKREEVFYSKDENNNFRLITTNGGLKVNTTTYDVYSLSGTLSTIQESFFGNKKFNAYPNPSTNSINIANPLKKNEKENIIVYDINGRKVLEKEVIGNGENIKLNISSLSKGIYNYRIRENGNKFVKE